MRRSIFAGLVGAALCASAARAGAAPDAGAADAGKTCRTSGDCIEPLPYCHATRHVCVECLGDRNCIDSTGLCDVARGVCAACADDSSCSEEVPYCEPGGHVCVQCLTDANCGIPGMTCVDHRCGSCGDGICGPNEALTEVDEGPIFPGRDDDPIGGPDDGPIGGFYHELCVEDCLSACPEEDLGSAIGTGVARGSARTLHDRMANSTCGGSGQRDRTFRWKAPEDGTYLFNASRSDGFGALIYTLDGGCTGEVTGCGVNTRLFELHAGDPVTFVIDGLELGTDYVLDIYRDGVGLDAGGGCNPFACPAPEDGALPCCTIAREFLGELDAECGAQRVVGCDPLGQGPPPPPPGEGGAPVDRGAKARCLASASAGKSPLCAAPTECLCNACPQELEDCRVVPGCAELLRCMVEEACAGEECDAPDACGGLIASTQGTRGAAFRVAMAVRTCGEATPCELTCPVEDAGADGGRACDAGAEVACTCAGGGTGVRSCTGDGSGYGECACGGPDASADAAPNARVEPSGGCDCGVARSPKLSPWAALALAALGRLRRKSRSGARR